MSRALVLGGTGVVTRRLREALDDSATLVATDLNEAMVDYARVAVPAADIVWQQADAQALAFDDSSHQLAERSADPDAVVGALADALVPLAGGRRPFKPALAATIISATR